MGKKRRSEICRLGDRGRAQNYKRKQRQIVSEQMTHYQGGREMVPNASRHANIQPVPVPVVNES